MSKQVDERVVEMRFDNQQFEKNVSTTMSTLDKLKQKLNLTGASKGLEDVGRASKQVDMSGLSNGVGALTAKFSALDVVAVTALTNITNKAINAGERLVKSLSIDQISSGWQKFSDKTTSVATLVAQGNAIEDVNDQLNRLNWFTDETSYNFTDMVSNIAKFTATGKNLEESVNAMEGIATWAALSGQNATTASRAMYQLSQALSSGYMRKEDWKSIQNASMDTDEFRQKTIDAAVALGKLKDNGNETYTSLVNGAKSATDFTKAQFADSLTEGQWFDTEVMMAIYQQYASAVDSIYEVTEETGQLASEVIDEVHTKADELKTDVMTDEEAIDAAIRELGYTLEDGSLKFDSFALKAFEASQKARTFNDAIDSVKDAVSTGWMNTFELIFGNAEKATELWTDLANTLYDVFAAGGEIRNAILKSALGKTFTSIVDNVKNMVKPIQTSADSVKEVVDAVKDYAAVVDEIIGGKWGNGQERWNKLTEAGYDWAHAQNLVNEKLGDATRRTTDYVEAQGTSAEAQTELTESTIDLIVGLTELSDAQLKEKGYTDKQIEAFRELASVADKTGIPLKELLENVDEIDGRYLLINSFKNAGRALLDILDAIKQAWREAFYGDASDEDILAARSEKLFNFIATLHKLSTKLKVSENTAKKLTRTFKGVFALLGMIGDVLGGSVKLAFKAVSAILGYFNLDILDITAAIGDALVAFRDATDVSNIFGKAMEKVAPFIATVAEKTKDWSQSLMELPLVQSAIDSVVAAFDKLKEVNLSKITSGVKNFVPFIQKLAARIKELVKAFSDLPLVQKIIEGITSAFDKLKEINLTTIGQNIIEGFNGGLQSDVWTTAIKLIGQFAQSLIDKFCEIMGIASPSTVFKVLGGFIVAGLIAGIVEGAESVPAAFQEILDTCIEMVKGIDWNTIVAVGLSIGALKTVNNICDMLTAFASPFQGLGKILNNAASVVAEFKNFVTGLTTLTKDLGFEIKTKAIKNLAVSLGILAVSLVLLTKFYSPDMWKAVGVIGALALILVGLAFATEQLSKSSINLSGETKSLDISGLKTSLMAMGVAILLVAAAVKLIGSMKWTEALQGILGLVGIMSAMVLFMYACGQVCTNDARENITQISGVMIKMAFAIGLMAVVMKLIGSLDDDEVLKGITFITGFIAFIGLLNLVTRGTDQNIDRLSNALLKVTVAMGLMVGVVKLIGFLKANEMIKGAVFAAGFIVFIKALTKVTTTTDKTRFLEISGIIMSVSFSLMLLAGACKIIGLLSVSDMAKGVAFVAGFTVFLKTLIKILTIGKEDQIAKVGLTMLSITVALGVMAVITLLLGMIKLQALTKGIAAMGMLSLFMTLMIKATKGATDIKGTMVALSTTIAVMAAAIVALSLIKDTTKLAASVLALASIMGMFAVILLSLKGVDNKAIGSLIVITAAIAVIDGILILMSEMEVEVAIKNAAAIGILLTTMAGALWVATKIDGNKILDGVLALVLMAVPMLAFIEVLKRMNGVENAIENVLTLIGLMTAMTALLAAVTVISKLGGGLTALKGIGLLTAMCIPMAAFVAMLYFMPNISSAEANVKLLVGLMAAMTALLAILTIIGIGAIFGVLGIAELTLMIIPMNELVKLLSNMDDITGAADSVKLLVNLMTDLTGLVERLSEVGLSGLIGVKALDNMTSLVVKIGAFATLVGALVNKFPQLQTFLDKGLPILEQLCAGIGSMIGSFVSGIMTGLTSGLPQIGSDLSAFMINATPFIVGAKLIDESITEGVKSLATAVLALAATDLITAIADFVSGGISLPQLGTDLSRFMLNAMPFIALAKTVDTSVVDAASSLAQAILTITGAEVVNKLASFIPHSSDFTDIGTTLAEFGEAVVAFSNVITQNGGIDAAAVQAASDAGMLFIALQNSMPRTGGIWQQIVGEKDIADFGEKCLAFGEAMISFSNLINDNGGINVNAIEDAANAGDLMSELQNSLPKTDGLWQKVTGTENIATFGERCIAFGEAMIAFSNSITANGGIDTASIEAAADAGDLMSELENSLPKTDGAWQKVAGKQDIATFGEACVAFGEAMAKFPSDISITDATIESVKAAGELMLELQEALPKTDGALQKVAGQQDLESFTNSCKAFAQAMRILSTNFTVSDKTKDSIKSAGEMMIELQEAIPKSSTDTLSTFVESYKSFADTLKGIKSTSIDTDAIASVKNAGDMFLELQKSMPDDNYLEGKMDFYDLSNALWSFSSSLQSFGQVTISPDTIQSAETAGNMIVSLQKAMPDEEALDGKMEMNEFIKIIKNFGKALVSFSEVSVSDEAVQSADNAGRMMLKLQDAMSDEEALDGKMEIDTFGKKIKKFGGYLAEYAEQVSGIEESPISSSITQAKQIVSFASSLVDFDPSGIDNFKVKKLGSAMGDYAEKVAEMDTGVVSSSITSAGSLVSLIRQLVDLDPSGVSNFDVKSIGKSLETYSNSVSKMDHDSVSSSITSANRLKNLIRDLVGLDTSGVDVFKTAIETLGTTQIGNLEKAFSDAASVMNNIGAQLIENIAAGMNSKQSKVINNTSSLVTAVYVSATTKTSSFKTAGISLMGAFISGIESKKKNTKSAFSSSITNAISSIRIYYNSFYNAGNYLVEGFASGITANDFKAEAAAAAMAEAAYEAAKEALDVNSPSKVFRKLGYSIPEGFAMGVDKLSGMANNSAVSMADGAISAVKNSISRIADTINTNVDAQPTIRPVMDLSDVEAGANSINSMLGFGTSVGVMANVGAISSAMNRTIQNGINSDVVAAINKLRGDLGNVKGDTYNLGGFTYDDGSNVANAIKEIIRAARMERRV